MRERERSGELGRAVEGGGGRGHMYIRYAYIRGITVHVGGRGAPKSPDPNLRVLFIRVAVSGLTRP